MTTATGIVFCFFETFAAFRKGEPGQAEGSYNIDPGKACEFKYGAGDQQYDRHIDAHTGAMCIGNDRLGTEFPAGR